MGSDLVVHARVELFLTGSMPENTSRTDRRKRYNAGVTGP
jgi:hypothetical protein